MPKPTLPRSPLLAAVALVLLAGEAGAAEGGLVLIPDLTLTLALIALFVLLIFPVNALIFQPILRVFDDREERIAGTRRRADQLGEEANQIVARYEKAVREVREESENERRKGLEVARSESNSELSGARSAAEREIEGARSSIASELESARASLRGEAETLAREAAERVLGRAL